MPYKSEKPIKPLTVPLRMTEALVARFWNMKPWEFRALQPDRQAEAMAVYIVNNQIENYYISEDLKRAPRKEGDDASGMTLRSKTR